MRSELELAFLFALKHSGLDSLYVSKVQEHKFHPKRRWRFDFAWLQEKIAVEIDGGTHLRNGGRHNRDSDREKINEAVVLGWRVLRFSGTQVKNDPMGCVEVLKRAIYGTGVSTKV